MVYCIQIYPQGFHFFDIPEMTFKNGNVNMKTGSEHVGKEMVSFLLHILERNR